MKMKIEELLRKKGYFPLKSPSWNSFGFRQIEPKNDIEKEDSIRFLETQVTNKKGVYVYVNEFEQVFYIGKGSPIKNRLKSHFEKLSKNNSDNNKRIAFFQDNQGIVKIYWLEIEQKEEIEIVEHMLSFVLSPLYKNKWHCV